MNKERVLSVLVLCVVLLAAGSEAAALFTEDWQTGAVDPAKWSAFGGGGGFVYDPLGDGDYVYYLNNPFTYQAGLTSLGGFDRADNLVCSFKLWNDGAPLTYTGPGGPWWNTNTPGGTYPGLENYEAALGRMTPGSPMAYVEGTSSMSGMATSAQFNTDFAAAVSKATALTVRVSLGTSTGALAEWSTDGVSFTTIYDSRGMVAGTNYAGANLVSSTNPVYLGFSGAGGNDGATNARAVIDDIVVTPEPATMALLGLGGLALIRRRKSL